MVFVCQTVAFDSTFHNKCIQHSTCLSFQNIFYSAVGSALRLGSFEEDNWMITLPMYHIGGMAIVFRACLYGIAITIAEKFSAENIAKEIKNHNGVRVNIVHSRTNVLVIIIGN